MIRSLVYVLCIVFSSLTVAAEKLQLRNDFKNNLPVLITNHLSSAEQHNDGYRFYLVDSWQARNLLQVHSQAIADYDLNYTPTRVSLTNSTEYYNQNYTKQCIGFVKAVVTDRNWTMEHLRGNSYTIAQQIPQPYDIIGYFSGNAWSDGYYRYSGSNGHVAIYLGTYGSNHIMVLDQNHDNGGSLAVRILPWNSSVSSEPRMSAKNYRIVMK